jgi:hypothetical protein
MSFREKTAWVTLITLLVLAIAYFLHVPITLRPAPSPALFHGLIVLIGAFIVIEVVAYGVLYLGAPQDAKTPSDERDRLISLKAIRIAAYAYFIGSMGAVSTIHIGANQMAVAYGVLLAFLIAQIVNYAARILYYRRGS